jgi:hypothetical protein
LYKIGDGVALIAAIRVTRQEVFFRIHKNLLRLMAPRLHQSGPPLEHPTRPSLPRGRFYSPPSHNAFQGVFMKGRLRRNATLPRYSVIKELPRFLPSKNPRARIHRSNRRANILVCHLSFGQAGMLALLLRDTNAPPTAVRV